MAEHVHHLYCIKKGESLHLEMETIFNHLENVGHKLVSHSIYLRDDVRCISVVSRRKNLLERIF